MRPDRGMSQGRPSPRSPAAGRGAGVVDRAAGRGPTVVDSLTVRLTLTTENACWIVPRIRMPASVATMVLGPSWLGAWLAVPSGGG